ncbi:MAG: hypothetical protein WDM87_06235 [Terracidiphilus sp.]
MIRERLGGDTIKGAFFVWTTGLASTGPASAPQGEPLAATQSDSGSQSDAAHDVGPAIDGSHPGATTAVALASPPAHQPAVNDSQPAISCGVLELVKFTLELE